jgi:hypothetical protein
MDVQCVSDDARLACAFACGCRISPRRRSFVVGLSNDSGGVRVDSACCRGAGIASTILVGDLYNALDLCDSHA